MRQRNKVLDEVMSKMKKLNKNRTEIAITILGAVDPRSTDLHLISYIFEQESYWTDLNISNTLHLCTVMISKLSPKAFLTRTVSGNDLEKALRTTLHLDADESPILVERLATVLFDVYQRTHHAREMRILIE